MSLHHKRPPLKGFPADFSVLATARAGKEECHSAAIFPAVCPGQSWDSAWGTARTLGLP